MAAKVVTVFGATGAQGGSVVEALSHDPSCHVRAVTRNPRAQSSGHLHNLKGVEVVEADMNDVNSLKYALKGADACFLVTVTYFRTGEFNSEVQQGQNVADVCKELGIKQVVYSTVDPDWKQSTDIKVKELDQKIEIFSYMMRLNLPVVGVMPGFYYENILDIFKPRKVDVGVYGFGLPLEGACWALGSVKDLGPLVHEIFKEWREELVGEVIPLVTENLSLQEMSDTLNRHIPDAQFVDLKLTKGQVKQALNEGGKSEEILSLFDVVLQSSTDILQQKVNKGLVSTTKVSFDQWVEKNKDLIKTRVLSSS